MTHVRIPDVETLVAQRSLADELALPSECAHAVCRRAGNCRGPRTACAAFRGETLPGCLARGFDELHAPVARWRDLMNMIDRAGKLLDESPVAQATAGATRPGRGR